MANYALHIVQLNISLTENISQLPSEFTKYKERQREVLRDLETQLTAATEQMTQTEQDLKARTQQHENSTNKISEMEAVIR